jgi:hypothetical protein
MPGRNDPEEQEDSIHGEQKEQARSVISRVFAHPRFFERPPVGA